MLLNIISLQNLVDIFQQWFQTICKNKISFFISKSDLKSNHAKYEVMAHGQNLYYVNKKAYYVETNNSIDLA